MRKKVLGIIFAGLMILTGCADPSEDYNAYIDYYNSDLEERLRTCQEENRDFRQKVVSLTTNVASLKKRIESAGLDDPGYLDDIFNYNIFGEDEFDSVVRGYLKTKEVIVYDEKQENAYFIITEFEDEDLEKNIQGGIDRGNAVNYKEGDQYAFNLGCFEGGLIKGMDYIEGEPYIDDKTQETLLNSSSDNPVSVVLTFGYHGGSGCLCCNLAHKIRKSN